MSQQIALYIILACLVIFPTILVARYKNNAGATVVTSAIGLAAVLVFVPQIQSLSFGPLKAEMQKKITEAQDTIEDMKILAGSLAQVSVLSVVDQGDLGGPRYQTLYAIREKLLRQMTKLKLDKDKINSILHPLDSRIELAFGITIEDSIGSNPKNMQDQAPFLACAKLLKNEESNEKVQICLEKVSSLPPELDHIFLDLKDFVQTSHIKRLDNEADL